MTDGWREFDPEDAAADRFDDIPPAAEAFQIHSFRSETRRENAHPVLVWFGDTPPEPPPMLIRDLIPQGQIAIVAGVFSSGKTFVVGDLAACIMLNVPFAGREIVRPGGVLWLAAEGANEIDARIMAAAEARSASNVRALPFARQAFEVPKLTAPEAEAQLVAHADAFKAGLVERFPGVHLVAIVIDTLGSAAGFVDGNSSSEAQRTMDMLRRVNVATGALIVLVDHYGKAVETGVMGASAKAQSADAVLAILADKSLEGDISNRRMAVAKLRGGAGGAVTPFRLRQMPVGGFGGTTCVIDWDIAGETSQVPQQKAARPVWSPGGSLFKACMLRVLIDHGALKRPFGVDGPEVKTIDLDRVRTEFIASHAGDTYDAKKKQWQRMLKEATERGLVATRSLGSPPVDWAWFTTKGEEK